MRPSCQPRGVTGGRGSGCDELVRAPVRGGVEGSGRVQPRGDRRLVDVARVDLVAGELRGQQHDEAAVVEHPHHVDERIAEVTVAVAEPEQHGVGAPGVVLVLDLGAAVVLDGVAELVVDVGVVAELLDHLVAGEPEALDDAGATGARVARRWDGGVHGVTAFLVRGCPAGAGTSPPTPKGRVQGGARWFRPAAGQPGALGHLREEALGVRDVEVGEHRRDRPGRRDDVHGRQAEPGLEPALAHGEGLDAGVRHRDRPPGEPAVTQQHGRRDVGPPVAPPRQWVQPPGGGGLPAPRGVTALTEHGGVPGGRGHAGGDQSEHEPGVGERADRQQRRLALALALAHAAGPRHVHPDATVPAQRSPTRAAARARGPGYGASGSSSRAGRSAPPAPAPPCRRRRGGSCRW